MAEGFDVGGVDIDGAGGGVFAKEIECKGNPSDRNQGDPEPTHLAVACLQSLLTLFNEVVEGFAHGFECGGGGGNATSIWKRQVRGVLGELE